MNRGHRIVVVAGLATIGLLSVRPALSAGISPAPDASLAAAMGECSAMKLGGNGFSIKNETVDFGHMEISFAEGTLVPVVGKTGAVLGVYFSGRGGYVYNSAEAADRELMSANVALVNASLRPLQGRLTDQFKTALILFTDPQFTDLYGDDAAPHVPSAPLNGDFESMLAGAMSSYGEFEFHTALSRLNGGGRWVYAELAGGIARVGYVFDDLVDGRERLFGFRKVADYGDRFTETLSYQPLKGWNLKRRIPVTLTHAEFDVRTDDNKSGSISSAMTYRVQPEGTRAILLRLFSHHDANARDWASARHKLTLSKVLDSDGKELPFSHARGLVIVEIPKTAAPDTDLRLKFETSGEVFLDMKWEHADSYFTLGYEDWYPRPLEWAGQHFTFGLKVRCRKPWTPVTTGHPVGQKDDGDFVEFEAKSDRPTDSVTVFAGKYVTREEVVEGIPIRIHAYAMARKNVLDNMPKLAGAMVKTYADMLGPMPAPELDIIEVPEYGFGMSPSGVILLTTEAYKPHQDEVANYLARGINARLAHEIAHQWFGHKAVPADWSENWLSESFAEYFSGIVMGIMAHGDKTIYGFDRMLKEWQGEDPICANGAPIAAAEYLGGDSSWRDRRCLLYDRGPLVLHMLRTSIGNDRFMTAAKTFLDAADTGPASTDDLARAVSGVVQLDMGWYFDQWIRRSGNAQVDVDQHVERVGEQYHLKGTIRQPPGDGFKKLLVPFVWDENGQTQARVVFADTPEKVFDFPLATKPGMVKTDPHQNNLAVYK